MTGQAATSRDEARVLIPCQDEQLSAVFTRPTVPANGVSIVFYSGRWSVTSTGRSFMFVYLARRLARLGYHSLRLDYLGLGESTGQERQWDLARPFVEEPDAARDWLARHDLTDVVHVGMCGGARLVLGTVDRVEHLKGVVLLAPPVRDAGKGEGTAALPAAEFVRRGLSRKVLAGLRDPAKRRRYMHHLGQKVGRLVRRRGGSGRGERQGFQWVSPHFVNALETLVRRRVPVLLVFGRADGYYGDYERGRAGRLGKVLDEAGDLVTEVLVDGRFFGLTQTDMRRVTSEAIETWLQRSVLDAHPAPAGP